MKNNPTSWEKYLEISQKQKEEEMDNFMNGVEGWYGNYYYRQINGVMTPVESINGDNSLAYPD